MATSMQDYLKRYNATTTTRGDDEIKLKPKKKRKMKGSSSKQLGKGVIILDDDGVWQKEGKPEEEDDDEGDKPTVIEEVDVKVMQRMEALKSHRPYLSVANDGSGWVTVKGDAEAATEGRGGSIGNLEIKGGDGDDMSPLPKRYDSPDMSPPRRREANLSHPQKKITSGNEDDDFSPPRKRHESPDWSPPRRGEVTDLTPRRKKMKRERFEEGDDHSPSMKRHDSHDLSPPRPRKYADFSPPQKKFPSRNEDFDDGKKGNVLEYNSQHVPVRRKRDDSPDMLSPTRRNDADLSPSRKKVTSKNEEDEGDLSPPRKRKDTDRSPSRKKVTSRYEVDGDLSPKERHDSPISLPTRMKEIDLSPPRRKATSKNVDLERYERGGSGDLSPPRKRHYSPDMSSRRSKETDISPPRKKVRSKNGDDGEDVKSTKKHKMSDGMAGGLRTDKQVAEEIQRKKAMELKVLASMDPSQSGRGAETVYRDKKGRRLEGLEELLRQQKGETKLADKPLEWGKGLAQKRELEAKFAELEAEKSKPFARSRDDQELDKSLRDEVRWGDPMAHLVKKKMPEPVLTDLGASEEMKASGFIVPQDIPPHSWLKRGIAPPPNRYGIKPGRHWDGVDRSTGYERDMFKAKNEKQASEREAYLWSVSDM